MNAQCNLQIITISKWIKMGVCEALSNHAIVYLTGIICILA